MQRFSPAAAQLYTQQAVATYIQEPDGQSPMAPAPSAGMPQHGLPPDAPPRTSHPATPLTAGASPANSPFTNANQHQHLPTSNQALSPQPQRTPYPAAPQQAQAPPGPRYLSDLRSMTPNRSPASPATGPAGPPSRTRFSLFQRNPRPPPSGQPQGSAWQHAPPQQAYGNTSPYGLAGPYTAQRASPPPIEDAQPVQEMVGGNWIFLIFLPYFVATGMQDTETRAGLVAGTILAGVVLLAGAGARALNWRKVFPHLLELLMLVTYAVLLGVSYHSEAYKREVVRTYNFIVHSALAGTCLVSMLVCYPAGTQAAQEQVHRMYGGHPAVQRAGMYTTAVLTASFVSSCLLYLAPLCKGRASRHGSALNLVFRLIYPCLATAAALLFARLFPPAYLPNLAVVHGLNRRPQSPANQTLSPYLTDLLSIQPPHILDAAMYHTTVEAATKLRESQMLAARAAATASSGGAGSPGGGGGPTPRFAAGGGNYIAAGAASPTFVHDALVGLAAAGGATPLPAQLGYAAGVYGTAAGSPGLQHELYKHLTADAKAGRPGSPPPGLPDGPYGEPTLQHTFTVEPFEYAVPVVLAGQLRPFSTARVAPSPPPYGTGPHASLGGGGADARTGLSSADSRRRAAAAGMQQYGRPYASYGGAEPYAVNMPLGALAGRAEALRSPPAHAQQQPSSPPSLQPQQLSARFPPPTPSAAAPAAHLHQGHLPSRFGLAAGAAPLPPQLPAASYAQQAGAETDPYGYVQARPATPLQPLQPSRPESSSGFGLGAEMQRGHHPHQQQRQWQGAQPLPPRHANGGSGDGGDDYGLGAELDRSSPLRPPSPPPASRGFPAGAAQSWNGGGRLPGPRPARAEWDPTHGAAGGEAFGLEADMGASDDRRW